MIGLFANTMVLRTELGDNPRCSAVLERVQEAALGGYGHQDLPFEKLVEELHPQRQMSHAPIFQVMFVLQNAPLPAAELQGLRIRALALETGTAKFDLTMYLTETEGRLEGLLEYNTDLFEGATMERLAGHYQKVLEGMVGDVEQRVGELPLLTEAEREQVVEGWNRTEVEYEKEYGSVQSWFEAQVERTPQAVALVYEGQELSYEELNGRANQLARYLRRQGVGPEVRVGVCVERSLELVVALLAVLKAGGAYVPLDPDYPPQRLSFMVEDAGVRIVLTRENGRSRFAQQVGEVFSLDTDWSRVAGEASENLIGSADGDHAAYIIYTSGSTGQPKGVVTVYRGVNNQLGWLRSTIPLTGSDRVLQRTSIGVDASIVEILPTLVAGARVVVARQDKAQDMQYLVRLIAEHKITYIDTSPSLLRALLDCPDIQSCHSLRVVVTGGEPLSLELEERFFSALSADLYNMYGPTEATVQSTCWKCLLGTNHRNVPIGRPIANT